MLTLSSPPRQKLPCFISFQQSGQYYKVLARGGGGGGGGGGGEARFLEQNFVNGILSKSLMKTDCIGHRLTFFVFPTKSAFNLLFSEFCCFELLYPGLRITKGH